MQHFFYYCVLHTNLMFIPPLKNSSMMVMTGFIRYLWPPMLHPLIICLALPQHGCQFPILMGSIVFLREYLENARSLNRYQAHPNLFTRTVTSCTVKWNWTLMKNYQLNGGWLFQLIMQRENGAWTSIEVLNWTIKAGIMEKNRNRATLLNTYIWK